MFHPSRQIVSVLWKGVGYSWQEAYIVLEYPPLLGPSSIFSWCICDTHRPPFIDRLSVVWRCTEHGNSQSSETREI